MMMGEDRCDPPAVYSNSPNSNSDSAGPNPVYRFYAAKPVPLRRLCVRSP